MGKYEEVLKNIYGVFDGTAWKDLNINTQPENYKGITTETIVITPLFTGGSLPGTASSSVSGMIMIDIFVEANKGPLRAHQIAGELDLLLVEKSIVATSGNVTQLLRSSLASIGLDAANKTLYRYSYSIPFNHFGAN